MPRAALPLVLAALCLALVSLSTSLAQETGATSFTLVSAEEGADYVWHEEGRNEKNPTLVVAPSTQITITAKKGDDDPGIPHNLRVGASGNVSDTIQNAGDSVTYTFTAPGTGTLEYVCTIHPTTMKGTVRVAGTSSDGGDGGNGAPGLPVVAVLATMGAIALLAGRRAG